MSTTRILAVVMGLIPMTIGCESDEVEQPPEVVGEPIEPPGKVLPEQVDPAPVL
ncbi:hypothetical protein [Stieleria magnilauensis]|uniref:Uncharacterized protein n=1 Tax=Stieleria magnilauensis TaxID=2527963 RepID=A0ABX5XK61_9BACT|nr:hypothetical protein TBK1r_11910 [Planctomycetes bacterium TBK1r]